MTGSAGVKINNQDVCVIGDQTTCRCGAKNCRGVGPIMQSSPRKMKIDNHLIAMKGDPVDTGCGSCFVLSSGDAVSLGEQVSSSVHMGSGINIGQGVSINMASGAAFGSPISLSFEFDENFIIPLSLGKHLEKESLTFNMRIVNVTDEMKAYISNLDNLKEKESTKRNVLEENVVSSANTVGFLYRRGMM